MEKEERDRERFPYFKELAHAVIKASKSEIASKLEIQPRADVNS